MPRAEFHLAEAPRYRDDPLRLACELAHELFAGGETAVILARSLEQAEQLDEKLWEFDDDAFVPHQIAGDEDDAITPVLIVPPDATAPARNVAINLRDTAALDGFARVLEIVPADPAQREDSRRRWKAYQQAGFALKKCDR